MIDALVTRKLYGQAEQRTAKSGKPFTTARIRAAVGESEALFVSVVCFSESAQAVLLALQDGDAVSIAGQLTPKAWVDREGQARPGADLVAQQVLSVFSAKRKRSAVQPKDDAGHDACGDDSGFDA